MTTQLEQAWELAKQRFAAVGIDVEEALRQLDRLPVSMHCWQGDDVAGFENPEGSLTGGIQSTGNYPGKARNATELRADLEQALRLIPGPKRLNLHAIYLESDTPVARDQIKPDNGAGKSTLLSLITGDHPQGYSNDLTLFGRRRGSGETIWDIKK
ncbi:L-rhamnose isomerase, partial [Salmonella enterica subsp. enterica serovar Kentucky]|nr:L-rhamnose isomerase [Salmonella enterica subsp. enterica serovar Kentucky]